LTKGKGGEALQDRRAGAAETATPGMKSYDPQAAAVSITAATE
jgi:hypothetical protein